MSALRIFSYLPNPRVWKATIAGELCDVEVELLGAHPRELGDWLWDFDARPLDESEKSEDSPHARRGKRGFSGVLYKTDAFLDAHPFGTVPAAFSPDGEIGIFESNSILRAVARAGAHNVSLYGANDWEASRIDSFLDANLVFAREAQEYLLKLQSGKLDRATHRRMSDAFDFYLTGIDTALERSGAFVAGKALSIADISFACDLAQFLRERFFAEHLEQAGLDAVASVERRATHRPSFEHLEKLLENPAFARNLAPYLHKEPVAGS